MAGGEVQLDPSEALKLADEIDYLSYEEMRRVQHFVSRYMLTDWEGGGTKYFTALQRALIHV